MEIVKKIIFKGRLYIFYFLVNLRALLLSCLSPTLFLLILKCLNEKDLSVQTLNIFEEFQQG